VEGRALGKLVSSGFDPNVLVIADPLMELTNEPRLPYPRLAHYHHDLSLALAHPTTAPGWMPTLAGNFASTGFSLSRDIDSRIARPARAARSASFSCAAGQPKYAITPRYWAT
jgi:hypothetical protein